MSEAPQSSLEPASLESPEEEVLVFPCREQSCNFTATSRIRLLEHESGHAAKQRSYHCDICHMRFTLFANMRRHRLTHLGVRPFECSLCPKKFFRKDHLTEHVVRQHSKQRPYRCPFCIKSFNYKPHLKSHLSYDHGSVEGANNLCLYCGYQAATPHDLKIHFSSSCHPSSPPPISAKTTAALDFSGLATEEPDDLNRNTASKPQQEAVDSLPEASLSSPPPPHNFFYSHQSFAPPHFSLPPTSSSLISQSVTSASSSMPPAAIAATSYEDDSPPPTVSSTLGKPGPPTQVRLKSEPPETSVDGNSRSTTDLSSDHIPSTESNMVPENLTTSHRMPAISWVAPVNYSARSLAAPAASTPPGPWPSYVVRNRAQQQPAPAHSPEEYKVPTSSHPGPSRPPASPPRPTSLPRPAKLFSEREPVSMERNSMCPYCGIIFPDRTLYFLHRSLHTDASPWKCNLCGRQCQDKYDFNAHIISLAHN
ncbi:hypothetical protein LAZ67_14001624 [Cordylochernes scorpioides]|uniref:C2H2-type domain-containing protein n=1 Tax=Cordylochernes scorpioides TaxID=51811 RepID=A0ABY6L724_9ARAC|nr:hypothetical protein LAZ67_14001624 [Cordylochernes scorpioides]